MTAAEALALARSALEDDNRATPGPWFAKTDGSIYSSDAGFAGPAFADRQVVKISAAFDCDLVSITAARTREPALARWVEAVMGAKAPPGGKWTQKKLDGDAAKIAGRQDPATVRAMAAALLRAADEAEASR